MSFSKLDGQQTLRAAFSDTLLAYKVYGAGSPTNNTSTTPPSVGRSKSGAEAPIRKDYSAGSVTTAAYVQLVAATTGVINKIQIFDSSGSVLKIAVGAAASEVDQIFVFPGGNGDVDLLIPVGSRISIKAVDADATTGQLLINCFS